MLAKFFGESRGAPTWLDLTITGALTCLPLAIIAKEPDLGTAVTLLPVFLGIACVVGLRVRLLGYLALSLVLVRPSRNRALKDYQKTRISTFLDPSQDAKGAGYQQIQARITVGSGGFLGKGFRQVHRVSCGSSLSRTTISSSRCWPRARSSPASLVTLGPI